MNPPLDAQALAARHGELASLQLIRRRRTVEERSDPEQPARVRVAGRLVTNFCGNDYLGLGAHPELAAAAGEAMRCFGFGAGASHLVTGHCGEHAALEEELAAFTGRERALLFGSGYLANVGVLAALAGRHTPLIADRLCHASLLDGARLAGARLRRYAHADASQAERLLASAPRGALLLTEGVFSMDGDVAPLAALAGGAHRHGAALLVDDAHGLGVLGGTGRGSLEHAGLGAAQVPLLIGTLGKAFGALGAFVAGEAALIEHLLQHARTYIYTTALPPAVAAAARAALRLADRERWRRERLFDLIRRWRRAAAAAGLPLTASETPIQPLIVGESARALTLSEALMARGFWVAAIRPPTVPSGTARLRVSLSAAHREADVEALAATLGQLWRQ